MVNFFLLLLIVAQVENTSADQVAASLRKPEAYISENIKDLDSKYYLRRAQVRKAVDELGAEAVPILINGLDMLSLQGQAEVLMLLHDLVKDAAHNPRVHELLTLSSPTVRLKAVKYLAGHPGAGQYHHEQHLAWSRAVFNEASHREKAAYLEGIQKPAPRSQIDLAARVLSRMSPGLQLCGLEALKKGWRSHSAQAFHSVIDSIRGGGLDANLLLPAMENLADVATEHALPSILFGMTSSSADLRMEGIRAYQEVVKHLFRARRFDDLTNLYARLHSVFSANQEYVLDYADVLIQYSDDLDKAASLMDHLNRELLARYDSKDRVLQMEINMGAAVIAFWQGEAWEHRLDSEPPPSPEGDISDRERRILAARDLLKGALSILAGEEGYSHFLSALERAPYSSDYAEIDGIFSGRFSTSNLVWRLNQEGRVEDSEKILDELVRALRDDPSRSGYFPDPEDDAVYMDRVRSRIPLNRIYFLLWEKGDPHGALKHARDYLQSIRDSGHPANMELLSRAYYYEGLATLDLERFDEAKASFRKGIKICEQETESLKKIWQNASVEAAHDYYNWEKARGLLYLEAVNTYTEGDLQKCESLVREAIRTSPDFEAPVLALALVQVRQGRTEFALEVMNNMDPYPDRSYNTACLHALLGNRKEALKLLKDHLSEYTPPGRLHIEKKYALNDPDLKVLRSDPDFIALVE